jgi:ATP-dependent Clp protease protease subunit
MGEESRVFVPTESTGVSRAGRAIYFFDEVSDHTVLETIRHLDKLESESTTKPICIIINSGGGYCYDGLALYDRLRACKCRVDTLAMGLVASMAFIIYLAGERRTALKNTRFLNHQVSSYVEGRYSDFKIETNEIKKLEEICQNIVSERTNTPVEKLKKEILEGNNYFGLEEAITRKVVNYNLDKNSPFVRLKKKLPIH